MDIKTLARNLINEDSTTPSQTCLDRILLRIADNPSLLSFLNNGRAIDDDSIEIVFNSVPDEYIDAIKQLLAAPKVKTYKFKTDEVHPMLGFRLSGFKNHSEASHKGD